MFHLFKDESFGKKHIKCSQNLRDLTNEIFKSGYFQILGH